jgi:hypothetical protein
MEPAAIYPSRTELARGQRAFRAHVPRDIFYRAALPLVALARSGDVDLTVGEALGILLQTWNRSYYRYRPVTEPPRVS